MKLYMAGPLFSLAERAFNLGLAICLRDEGYVVYLPQEIEEKLRVSPSTFEIFEQNRRAIDACDVVLACVDGSDPDSGTSWELGYAFAKGKPTLVYRTDFRLHDGPDRVNLMLTESATNMVYVTEGNEDIVKLIDYHLAVIKDKESSLQ